MSAFRKRAYSIVAALVALGLLAGAVLLAPPIGVRRAEAASDCTINMAYDTQYNSDRTARRIYILSGVKCSSGTYRASTGLWQAYKRVGGCTGPSKQGGSTSTCSFYGPWRQRNIGYSTEVVVGALKWNGSVWVVDKTRSWSFWW